MGSYAANPLGLYDLGGNVWEWCEDWVDQEQKGRVVRGSSWGTMPTPMFSFSAWRFDYPPAQSRFFGGFRVVLAAAGQ